MSIEFKENKHIILIHGTWCKSELWGDFIPALQKLGLTVHAPSLRYHDLPYDEAKQKVAGLSLSDYVDDFSELLLSLDSPPIILGHSLGGLIAQLLAAKHPDHHRGLILLGTAPMAGIFALYPSMLATFYKHYLQWGFWKKPLLPDISTIRKYIMNNQPQRAQDEFFADLVPESGRVYAEMAFWFLDAKKAAKVDTEVIYTPVLLITGTQDRVVVSNISKDTAKKYKRAKLVVLEGSDHMYEMGEYMPKTIQTIRDWLKDHQLN